MKANKCNTLSFLLLTIVSTLFLTILSPLAVLAEDEPRNTLPPLLTTGFELTVTDMESGVEFTSWFQVTTGGGVLLLSTSYEDGSVFFVNINQSFFQNAEGFYDSQQVIITLNASPTPKILRLRTGIYNENGIQQPLLGGTVSIDSFEIISNGDTPVATMHSDGELITSTALWGSTNIQCGNTPGPCLSGEFGNGLSSIPTDQIFESYGVVFEYVTKPFDIKSIDLDLKVNSTSVCPDLDGDGEVGSSDLGILLGAFYGDTESYDLDQSGVVDSADLGILLGGYGSCDPNS